MLRRGLVVELCASGPLATHPGGFTAFMFFAEPTHEKYECDPIHLRVFEKDLR